MKVCPECKTEYSDELSSCPLDGSILLRKRPEDKLIGKTIDGKYRVLERVAGGGMGSVYRAEHTLMKRVVAIKVLHPHLSEGEDQDVFLRRFQREARTSSQLSHPNAVTIHDFGVFEGEAYLVMQYVEGVTLKTLLSQRGRIQLPVAVTILSQVGAAIQSAHELGIVHRDLKPDNIVVSERPNGGYHAVVLDFGIAKVLGHEEAGSTVTRTGRILGTPQYMSPEQVLGGAVDARTDIYALGIIVYEMLSGEIPFAGDSLMPLMMKHVHESPAPLRQFKPELAVPAAVEACVMRAIRKEPNARYQSAEEFSSAFAAAADQAEPVAWDFELERPTLDEPVEDVVVPPPIVQQARNPLLAAACIGLAAAAVSFFVYQHFFLTPVGGSASSTGNASAGVPGGGLGAVSSGGVGMRVEYHTDGLRVLEIFPGSDADQAGIKPADLVVSIDGSSVPRLGKLESLKRMRGQIGSDIRLGVLRAGSAEPEEKTLRRGPLLIPAVQDAKFQAEQLLAEGKSGEAVSVLEKIAELHPGDPIALAELGLLYQRVGRLSDAISRYDAAIALDEHYAAALYNRGNALQQLGRLKEAEQSLVRALELDASREDTYQLLAETRSKLGDIEGAVSAYVSALQLAPNNAYLHFELGVNYALLGSISEAVREYERAIELNPNDSRMRGILGGTYTLLGRFDEAERHLDEALRLNPNNPEAHLYRAAVHRQAKHLDQALAAYDEALRLNPGYLQAYKGKAQLLTQEARYDEALPVLQEIRKRSPNDSSVRNNLGWVLNNLGRFQEAVPVLQEALELNPSNPVAHYNLGTAWGNLGQFSEAKSAFEKAVDLDPGYAVAQYNLGKALERLGDHGAAQTRFKQALALAPGSELFERALQESLQRMPVSERSQQLQ